MGIDSFYCAHRYFTSGKQTDLLESLVTAKIFDFQFNNK